MPFLADVGKLPGTRTTVFLYIEAALPRTDGHSVRAQQFGAASVISSISSVIAVGKPSVIAQIG